MGSTQTTRRAFLTGAAATVTTPLFAQAPERSLRPRLRPATFVRDASHEIQSLIDASGLTGDVSFVVSDAFTGEILEKRAHLRAMPPASTAKAVTALYAIDKLGAGHRYRTQLIGTGTLRNGILDGDLILVASSDPVLDTDDLGAMAEGLKASGVNAVNGRFLVVPGPVQTTRVIDPGQPDQVAYNPSLGGLNLNFNRVHFEWKRADQGHAITMQARSVRYRPEVTTSRMEVQDRNGAVFTYEDRAGVDYWTVAKSALGRNGARWLPVRDPFSYATEVFRTVARSFGIELKPAERIASLPSDGVMLYEHVGAPMTDLVSGMLEFSTNLTAEVLGQSATARWRGRSGGITGSASAMSDWANGQTRSRRARFVDHSGLGPETDITARDMAAILTHGGPQGALPDLMKPWYFRTDNGGQDRNNPVRIAAKTGTLNFVSALAGYVLPPGGRAMTFAILTSNEDERRSIPREARENPRGARPWARRSRRLQDQLLKRWTDAFAELS